jgi:hypothetical protein
LQGTLIYQIQNTSGTQSYTAKVTIQKNNQACYQMKATSTKDSTKTSVSDKVCAGQNI